MKAGKRTIFLHCKYIIRNQKFFGIQNSLAPEITMCLWGCPLKSRRGNSLERAHWKFLLVRAILGFGGAKGFPSR